LQLIDKLEKIDPAKAEEYRQIAGFTDRPNEEVTAELNQLTNTQAVASAASQYGVPFAAVLCKN